MINRWIPASSGFTERERERERETINGEASSAVYRRYTRMEKEKGEEEEAGARISRPWKRSLVAEEKPMQRTERKKEHKRERERERERERWREEV